MNLGKPISPQFSSSSCSGREPFEISAVRNGPSVATGRTERNICVVFDFFLIERGICVVFDSGPFVSLREHMMSSTKPPLPPEKHRAMATVNMYRKFG